MRDETADLYARVHHRVDEILHYMWDPIGVSGTPEARDEYDSYVPGIVKMLLDGAEPKMIEGRLHSIATKSMGLSGSEAARESTQKVVRTLVENVRWIQKSEAIRK
jgi:hypothetical protein